MRPSYSRPRIEDSIRSGAGSSTRKRHAGTALVNVYNTREFSASHTSSTTPISSDQAVTWPLYIRPAQSACNNRKVFLTKNGYIGIGPKAMHTNPFPWSEEEEFSELWIIIGSRTPFIL